jgi:hypothetical protein
MQSEPATWPCWSFSSCASGHRGLLPHRRGDTGSPGPLRDLEERVVPGGRACIPSGQGGEIEVELEKAEVKLQSFEEEEDERHSPNPG